MENPNEVPNKLHLFDDINTSLKQAKAIACLMAYAAKEGSLDFGEDLIWAHQVVDTLIDDAMKSVAILTDLQQEEAA